MGKARLLSVVAGVTLIMPIAGCVSDTSPVPSDGFTFPSETAAGFAQPVGNGSPKLAGTKASGFQTTAGDLKGTALPPAASATDAAPKRSFTDTLAHNRVTAALSAVAARGSQLVQRKRKPFSPRSADPISLAHKSPPPSADLFVSVARLRERSGNMDDAVEYYQKALGVAPDHRGALLGLARLEDRQGRFEAAIGLYRKTIELHPNDPTPQNDLGLCYARKGQFVQAAESLRQATRLAPEGKRYRNNLAAVLVELNRTNDAFDELKAAHGPAIAHYNLGILLQQRGETEPAARHYAEALRYDPQMKAARDRLVRLNPPAGQQANGVHSLAGPASPTTYPVSKPHHQTEATVGPIASSSSALGRRPRASVWDNHSSEVAPQTDGAYSQYSTQMHQASAAKKSNRQQLVIGSEPRPSYPRTGAAPPNASIRQPAIDASASASPTLEMPSQLPALQPPGQAIVPPTPDQIDRYPTSATPDPLPTYSTAYPHTGY
ncbi:MAG: tetratricopeptide repeat protein [Pirellulales bacterium]